MCILILFTNSKETWKRTQHTRHVPCYRSSSDSQPALSRQSESLGDVLCLVSDKHVQTLPSAAAGASLKAELVVNWPIFPGGVKHNIMRKSFYTTFV